VEFPIGFIENLRIMGWDAVSLVYDSK